jgi:hypothetical protein
MLDPDGAGVLDGGAPDDGAAVRHDAVGTRPAGPLSQPAR